MKATIIVIVAALLSSGNARAQAADVLPGVQPGAVSEAVSEAVAHAIAAIPPARLTADAAGRFGPLAAGFKQYRPLYGGNESANPNDRQFPGFRTDPRLVIGYAFNRYFALETGYSHLRDKGFHKIDQGSPLEAAVAAGALGVKSHTTYVAAKITLPVNDRLSAYGKFGVAQSTVKNDGFLPPDQVRSSSTGEFVGMSTTGAYRAVGANYKLNDKATLSGEVRSNGSANQFGRASNASGLKGSIGIGF